MAAPYHYTWQAAPPYPGYNPYQPPPPGYAPAPYPPQPAQQSGAPPQSTTSASQTPSQAIAPAVPPPPSLQPAGTQTRGSDDDQDDGEGDGVRRAVPGYPSLQWERGMRYTNEGVAELRREWERTYANKPMPPPPPEVFQDRETGVASAKAFAKAHGYTLTIGHSNRDKDGEVNRVLFTCTYGGKIRDSLRDNPEARKRKRFSRKTGCLMKMRLQRRRFSPDWIMCISHATHNHAPDGSLMGIGVSEYPDLESRLHEWHLAELAKGETPHGNTLKARALALFAEMPLYRSLEPPDLDRKWLDSYRQRYNMPGRTTRNSGPPQLINWDDAEASAAAAMDIHVPRTRENAALNGLEAVFDDPALLRACVRYVKDYMIKYDASHDFEHCLRVVSLAKKILRRETLPLAETPKYDAQAIYLAALCHDLGDHKYNQGENTDNIIGTLIMDNGGSSELALKVQLIARNVSFSNEVKNPRMMKAVLDGNPELGIVQDADRLDAMGAIGIGRTFTYNGAKMPDASMADTIKHFTDKLERLESMMKTDTGRMLARQRTERLQIFRSWWEEENAVEE